jgi:hypothetical protein
MPDSAPASQPDAAVSLACADVQHGRARRQAKIRLAISRDTDGNTPETLRVHLTGRMKHGRIDARWLAPRR